VEGCSLPMTEPITAGNFNDAVVFEQVRVPHLGDGHPLRQLAGRYTPRRLHPGR
jgi:hypothetical protein